MRPLLCVLALAFLACNTPTRRSGGGDGTCDNPCGSACCATGEKCEAGACKPASTCTPRTCAQAGKNCGLVADGCGGAVECGSCEAPSTCGGGGVENVCGRPGCTPQNQCAALGKTCGSVPDGCGGVVGCGTCNAPETCGGGGEADVCGRPACTPTTCQAQERHCGTLDDGCGNTLDCGTCEHPLTCGGGGVAGVCGKPACVPADCAALGKNCGQVGDGCGEVITCGDCLAPDTCGGGGVANVCGRGSNCTRELDAAFCSRLGKECGTVTGLDNCDIARTANCGTCAAGSCGADNRCCIPESDEVLCQLGGLQCGTRVLADSCGGSRSVFCGECAAGSACGGDGRCSCSESDAALCQRRGNPCGSLTATDLCGVLRTVNCGACGSWALANAGVEPTHQLQSVSGSADNDIWAVGQIMGAAGQGTGVLYHWDGSRWTGMTLPAGTPSLWSVRARAANDVWAAGNSGSIVRFDGNGWTLSSVGGGYLDDAFALSATDAFAVGQQATGGVGRIVRFDGSAWALMPVATLPVSTDWHSVWAFGPNDAWVAGADGWTAHWDGAAWTGVQTPSTLDLRRLWAAPDGTLFAAGYGSTLLQRANGTWTVLKPAGTSDPRLFGVGGSSATNVFAAGNGSSVLRWDGTRVSRDDAPRNPNVSTCGSGGVQPCTAELRGLWVAPSGAVWVVGRNGYVARRAP